MKMIELQTDLPSLESLLQLAQEEDIVLLRGGEPIARLESFTEEDWQDWLFEHDPKVIQQTEMARDRLRRGEGLSLEEVARELEIPLEESIDGKDVDHTESR